LHYIDVLYMSRSSFWCQFNCDVNLAFGLTCFENFENWQIYICILYCFQHEVNYNVCSVIGLTHFGKFECVYTFCAIFICKFNYNVCLVIKIISFGNFQNQYIVICILYQFLMWIQLWWNKCIGRSAMIIKTWNWWIFWWQYNYTSLIISINVWFIHIVGYILTVT
jgi:hypothetical protein